MEGTVKRWIAGRNFGFIETKDSDKDVFVHGSDVKSGERLSEGQKVKFDVEKSYKGPRAKNVEIIK